MSEPLSQVELPERDGDGRASFEHDGRRYAVFTVAGEPVVTDGVCPHKGGPLAEGMVRDGSVICPWHWYRYDLTTGHCDSGDTGPLRRHPVERLDGRWYAWVGAPPQLSWSQRLRELARPRQGATPPDNG